VRDARAAGLHAQMELAGRTEKGVLKHADRLDARYVALVGETETVLKDMQGAGQETVANDRVVHQTLRGLRDLS
jgi:histidyl-tRNA synthetase